MKNPGLVAAVAVLAVAGLRYYGAHLPAPQAASGTGAPAVAQPGARSVTGGQPAGSALGQVTWITVRDQREQAFSIQVPQGWKTYGGLFRYGAIDARMVVNMTSPDGMTNLRIGDATVPPYRVPGPMLPPGPGVAAYASGNVFAAKYGQARFASMCTGVRMTKSEAVQPKFNQSSAYMHVTAGEAYFTCARNGTPMTAYVYGETELLGTGGPGSTWLVVALGSVISPTAQAAAAAGLLTHVGASLVMNPVWTQMQNEIDNKAAAMINASTQQIIAATEAENQREQAMISALNNDSFNDVINGVQEMQDPDTGRQYVTPIGTGNAQWIDGGNAVVESAMSPGPGYTPLAPAGR